MLCMVTGSMVQECASPLTTFRWTAVASRTILSLSACYSVSICSYAEDIFKNGCIVAIKDVIFNLSNQNNDFE